MLVEQKEDFDFQYDNKLQIKKQLVKNAKCDSLILPLLAYKRLNCLMRSPKILTTSSSRSGILLHKEIRM